MLKIPKIGPDKNKINKILKVLKKSGKSGVWLRELARQTKLPAPTVYYYLVHYLKDKIEIRQAKIAGIVHKQMKIIKLRD